MKVTPLVLTAAITVALGSPLPAATAVIAGTSESTVNKSITVADGTAVHDVESVNGGIRVGDNASVRSAETVNGAIRFGTNARAGDVETVNGRIQAGDGFVAEGDLETVNGSIELGRGATVNGSVETVNGSIELDQARVARNVSLVNGTVDARGTEIGGDLTTVNGTIELLSGTILAGDLIVKKPNNRGWSWGSRKGPTLIIGANSEVRGTIRVENDRTRLYVDPSARIGAVEGIEAETRAQ